MGNCDKPSVNAGLLYEWGDDELTESHQRGHLAYFDKAPGTVLEIGSGRGVLLRLMKEAGIKAYGLDSSDEAVRYCRDNGLDAVHGDAITHLSTIPDASLGGIFCGHVIYSCA